MWTIAWAGVAAILFACLIALWRAIKYHALLTEAIVEAADLRREDLSLCIAIAALLQIQESENAEGKVLAALAKHALRKIRVKYSTCNSEGRVK